MKRFPVLIAAALLCCQQLAAAQTLLIRDARVHTMTAAGVQAEQDVLLRDGRIEAIGRGLETPAGAEVIDAAGRPLTPALFAGITALGLNEVNMVSSSVDSGVTQTGSPEMRPEFSVIPAYNPHSSLIPVTRIEGFGFSVLGALASGSIIGGQGQAVRLDGGYDSLVGEPLLFVALGEGAAELAGGSRAAQWMLLEQAVGESRSAPRAGDSNLLTREGRAVMKEFLRNGTIVFSVNRASDILQVLQFAERHGFKAVIEGGAEAWIVAAELAAAEVPVLLDPLLNLPYNFDLLGARMDNAALLQAAGVTISFSGAGTHHARKQRQLAGVAAANGLDQDAALAALTINPARIFGLPGGRIEVGAPADLVIWSGDPLEVSEFADQVILGGKLQSMESRQTRLRDRYLVRDPKLPRAYLH
ncbi:amidohydrolase family protein [Haliea sp. E1-2-M8]|uniref:amidohydrolase family protein n=1 Tax=Haliea sp. E1-2-M8 TaxID=3064706 RepID=UPI00271B9057|nr:amidohydrolase family protein [Haliea sp. E1-2-M8]MDO8860551.1 amidohydrolase family protein [Haliea sp. E1-2-M8]